MSNGGDVIYSVVFLGFGVWAFFYGFMRLRRKRKIENIPTSTVRSLALGLVELIGQPQKEKKLVSPLSGMECVYYRYTVERYERRGRSGSWVKIASGDSLACPFWLDDGTGKILIFPAGAEFIMPVQYQFETGFGRPMPENLIDFLEGNSISYRGFLGNYSLRFREWYIQESDRVYILGTAGKESDAVDEHRDKLSARLETLRGNTVQMSQIDVNQDGQISEEEWDAAVAKIEQDLLEEELKSMPQGIQPTDKVIKQGSDREVFIISDYSQKELLSKLSWQAFGSVFGGAVLTLATLAYLLFRLNLVPF